MSEHPFLKGDTVVMKNPRLYGISGKNLYATVTSIDPFEVRFHDTEAEEIGYVYNYSMFTLAPNTTPKDNVNSPQHYNQNHKGIECIQAMEAMLTPEEFIGYLRGNIFKYLWRFPYKNGLEDVKKSEWYLKKLIEKLEDK